MTDTKETFQSSGSYDHSSSSGRDPGAEAGAEIRDAAERTAEKARSTAEQAAGQAREAAEEGATRAKDSVADEMSGIASALRTAASEMRDGSPQERTFGQIAEGLADASEAVRDRDLGEIAADLSDFARRNPLVFLGGAALAGFAATRFAKASQSTPSGGYVSDNMGSGSAPTRGGSREIDYGAIPEPATSPVPESPGGTAPRATTAPARPTPAPSVQTGPKTGM